MEFEEKRRKLLEALQDLKGQADMLIANIDTATEQINAATTDEELMKIAESDILERGLRNLEIFA